MGGSKEYAVTMRGKERVAAVLPVQEHWLPLSNLDLLLPAIDVGVFFCYKKPPAKQSKTTFGSMVSALKASLAQALVTYYPFAGEVLTNPVNEPELLCNNRGVDFIEAYADVELQELRLNNPDESVERKLLPKKKEGVLCVQATELKCGGLVLACTFDHRIADAYSANMFLVAWAETAVSKPISLAPTFRRSLLIPRRPGSYDSSPDRLCALVSSRPPPLSPDQEAAVSRICYVAADDIARIQAASGGQRTKFEAFTAYLWRVLARGARPEDKVCRMGAVVDGRTRLARGGEMAGYFGNVVSIPYGILGVEELKDMDLAETAAAVHGMLRQATTEEHFRGLVDWVEARRPEPAVARIYLGEEDGGVGCVVSSGRAFPVGEVEFGWGRAVFGSYHFPWGSSAGYVMPMPSARRNGDWVVYMHLLKRFVDVLEVEEPPVFRPLTADYFLADAK
ncbi:coniferyl alcohol acyltransferase-like [Phoenix dactylifera]|uniref:Coniferyl alcohol acyltransferase-like n=1 Tax=Phoenix dactylifera TaxID=42345 RepID=A0A8B9AJQ5_PHODC|nr:coniferyl alcohol acyltransferase-like [Phoenix dactylifera]